MLLSLGLVGAGLAGLAAAALVTIFEFAFWKKWGLKGVAEWQVNAVMVSALIRRFTARRAGALMAVIMHLVHATILGILFLILLILSQTPVLVLPTVGYGIMYSIVLWTVSPYLTRGLFEAAGGFRMTKEGLMMSFFAHIVYGAVLGLLVPVLVWTGSP